MPTTLPAPALLCFRGFLFTLPSQFLSGPIPFVSGPLCHPRRARLSHPVSWFHTDSCLNECRPSREKFHGVTTIPTHTHCCRPPPPPRVANAAPSARAAAALRAARRSSATVPGARWAEAGLHGGLISASTSPSPALGPCSWRHGRRKSPAAAAAESAALLLPSRRAPPIAAPAPTGPLQWRIGSSGFAASLVGAQARLASTSAAAMTSSTSLPPHSFLLCPPPFSRRFPLGVRACLPDAPRPHVLAHLLPTR
ncbi:hypothetical protein PVAP13_6KG003100 [Panicum virgatum]|uniref:Uncharacterized protein n=1 Tax=Panicum virgatum TaxID=38727 RepID=A0A8T0R7T6_PANVG|nr:hypothetical protein PVAP13_6KG003100 [Panicum virgatum]